MEEHKHEPVPYRTFILIWGALLVLTVVTIAVSRVHLGALNIWVALAIASVKSSSKRKVRDIERAICATSSECLRTFCP